MNYIKFLISILWLFYLFLIFNFSNWENYNCNSRWAIWLRDFQWNNSNKNISKINKCWSNQVRWPSTCNEYYEIINNWWELSISWYYLSWLWNYLSFSWNNWDILSWVWAFTIAMITNWLPNSHWYEWWICWWKPGVNWIPGTYYTYWVSATWWTIQQYIVRQDYYNPTIWSQVAQLFWQYYWNCWNKSIDWPTISNNINWDIIQIFEHNIYWNNNNWYLQSYRVDENWVLQQYYTNDIATLPTWTTLSWSELTIGSKFWRFNWYLKKLLITKSVGDTTNNLLDIITNCWITEQQYCNEKYNYWLLYSQTWTTLLQYSWDWIRQWLTTSWYENRLYNYKVMRCWIDDYIVDNNNNILFWLSWTQFKQINWNKKTTYYIIWSWNSIYLDFINSSSIVIYTWQLAKISNIASYNNNNCNFNWVDFWNFFSRLWNCIFWWLSENINNSLEFANVFWNITNLNQWWNNFSSWANIWWFWSNFLDISWNSYLEQLFYFAWFLTIFLFVMWILYFNSK